MTRTYEIVKMAIQEKRQVTGIYQGHYRELCPHSIGWDKSGNECAICYQCGGDSESGYIINGSAENWRCIKLEKLENVEFGEKEWHTCTDHSKRNSCVFKLDKEVAR